MALLAAGLYLPAFFSPSHDPVKDNLFSVLTGFRPFEPATDFYSGWQAAGDRLLAGRVPDLTGAPDQPQGQPQAEVPALYPLAAVYYLAGPVWGALAFNLLHLWLLGLGWFALARRVLRARPIRNRPLTLTLAGSGLLGLALTAILRPDWLAALAWLAPALWLALGLAHWRRWPAYTLLPLPVGLLALAGPLALSLALGGLILAWWLAVEFYRQRRRLADFGFLLKIAGTTLLALAGGLFLAGPQLFPRIGLGGRMTASGPTATANFAFTLGLYAAFIVLAAQALVLVVAGWVRFYREDAADHPLRRVVKNSATPLFAQLAGKVIDFGFAVFVLRLLGPEGNGQYAFAITTWVFFATICDFGLEGIVTREVARARDQAGGQELINRLFVTKLLLRLAFSVGALPLALLWIAGFGLSGNLSAASAWAIILFMVGFWPSAISGSITAVFRGFEKFEYLAAGQLLSAIIKVPLGLSALLAGWGVVGLAASSVVVNFIQVAVLELLLKRQLFRPRLVWSAFDRHLAFKLLGESYPLMLNGLIISILFKSDGLILQAIRGNYELGIYNSAYKFIDALLIIPSTLTMALFPLLSVYGTEAKENLLRTYREGLRLLLIIALPVSVGTLFVAHDLISFLGGAQYLPDGAIALQILIWFLPFSYINGLTQYVLIAINRQRSITWAVVVAAAANIALNILLIPAFGFRASAALTIVTELLLLVPFCLILNRALGPGSTPLLSSFARPGLAAGLLLPALGLLVAAGYDHFLLKVGAGAAIYLAGLILTRAITRQDIALLRRVVRR